MINKLRKLNPDISFYSIHDEEFKKYGRVINYDTNESVEVAKRVSMPDSGALYDPGIDILENLHSIESLRVMLCGGLDTQVGMVRGYNSYLNALEFHNSSEINVAVTPVVLLLGFRYEMDGYDYDSSKIKAFYLEKGDAIEVYATTLHFTPCQISNDGFGAIVMLPKGTNLPLKEKTDDRLLLKYNKWLICHKDNETLMKNGAYPGIYGVNYQIKY